MFLLVTGLSIPGQHEVGPDMVGSGVELGISPSRASALSLGTQDYIIVAKRMVDRVRIRDVFYQVTTNSHDCAGP